MVFITLDLVVKINTFPRTQLSFNHYDDRFLLQCINYSFFGKLEVIRMFDMKT